MSLDNPKIPRRCSRKIGPTWPNSLDSGGPIDIDVNRQDKNPVAEQNHMSGKRILGNDLNTKNECPNCSILFLQTQKQEKEKSKVVGGYEQTLQIIKNQEQKISELQNAMFQKDQRVRNNDNVKDLDKEIALLFDPLQKAMASAFRLKENKFWLTIRFSKSTGSITAVYTGRKSGVTKLSRSILSSGLG